MARLRAPHGRVVDGGEGRGHAAFRGDGGLDAGRQVLGQPGPEGRLDRIGLLVGDQPEGHLEAGGGGHDGLDARAAVAAVEADHLGRRPDADPLERA